MIRQASRALRPATYILMAGTFATSAFAAGDTSLRHGPLPGGPVTEVIAAVTPATTNDAPATAASTEDDVASPSGDREEERPLVRASWEELPLGRGVGEPVGGTTSGDRKGITSHWVVRTGLALAAVIALIFISKWTFQWLSGRAGGIGAQLRAGGRAPSGVLEVLARYPIARGQTLALLKLDRRILLVAQTGAGFQTLSEITHPDEVASILLKTRDDEGESMAARFAALLKDLERDPATAATPAAGARQAAGAVQDEYVPSSGRGADRRQVLRGGR